MCPTPTHYYCYVKLVNLKRYSRLLFVSRLQQTSKATSRATTANEETTMAIIEPRERVSEKKNAVIS